MGRNPAVSPRLPSHGSSDDAAINFLRAYRKIEQYDDNRPFLPGHHCRRLALGTKFAERTVKEVSSGLPARKSRKTNPSPSVRWQLAKDRLSPDAYAVLRLHYADDLSIKEVAQVLGKGKIATKVMLHRARKKLTALSDQLKDHYENPA